MTSGITKYDLIEELKSTQRQLQVFAVTEERTRMAREMHDSLRHRLTVTFIQLEGAQRLIPTDTERAARMIGAMQDEMKEALAELRRTVTALRAPITDDSPLAIALSTLSQTSSGRPLSSHTSRFLLVSRGASPGLLSGCAGSADEHPTPCYGAHHMVGAQHRRPGDHINSGGRRQRDKSSQRKRRKLWSPRVERANRAARRRDEPGRETRQRRAVDLYRPPAESRDEAITDKIRLLIVDDQRLMREGLRILLELEHGFEIVGEASNGQSALDTYAELKPDVVLMDIRMPGMDGVEATRRLCATWPETRVIILTT